MTRLALLRSILRWSVGVVSFHWNLLRFLAQSGMAIRSCAVLWFNWRCFISWMLKGLSLCIFEKKFFFFLMTRGCCNHRRRKRIAGLLRPVRSVFERYWDEQYMIYVFWLYIGDIPKCRRLVRFPRRNPRSMNCSLCIGIAGTMFRVSRVWEINLYVAVI